MFVTVMFMITLLKDIIKEMAEPRHVNELNVAIFKALSNMIWVSVPESVTEKCYGCSGVMGEVIVPKF